MTEQEKRFSKYQPEIEIPALLHDEKWWQEVPTTPKHGYVAMQLQYEDSEENRLQVLIYTPVAKRRTPYAVIVLDTAGTQTFGRECISVSNIRWEVKWAIIDNGGTETFYKQFFPPITEWYVSVFLIDQAYGGPEEGGWYYTCGEPQEETIKIFPTEEDANAYADSIRPEWREANENRNSNISSVASEGRFEVYVTDEKPRPFPMFRPHYE